MSERRVGHYRVLEQLGEGGMGVVHRAFDERLERFVALKFLPPHRAGDDAERTRFLAEARAASALNHPNVCVIHAIEDHGGEPFIVMELVEGETLRARIARGPVPIEQAVDWALQVGEALQDAHAHGVIHRDIKTENIMVTPRGRAKIMDFGLARLKELGQSTKTMSTLGTLAYMAPEQLREGASDARSDLYAFGVVLYELLTGRQPFRGEQHAAVMYAILNTEAEPLQSLRPGLASGWQHVIDRALEKDPADRYQSVADMVIELRRLQRETVGARARHATQPVPPLDAASAGATGPVPVSVTGTVTEPIAAHAPAAAPAAARRRVHPALVAAVVLAAVLGAWLVALRGAPPLNPNMTFRTLELPGESVFYPGMSKDGRWVAFPAADATGHWDLWFMNVSGGGGARRITGDSTDVITYVDVSPDGSQIAYTPARENSEGTEVHVVPSLGGTSVRVADAGQSPRWSPDGRRLGYLVASFATSRHALELWTVGAGGGDAKLEYRDTTTVQGRISFDWSPDGRSFAWIRSFRDGTQELFIVPFGGGRERQVTHDKANIDEVCWTRQDELVFSSNRGGNTNLWMVRASGGRPVQLTKGAGPDVGMKVSADGRTLLYLQSQRTDRLWLSDVLDPRPHVVPTPEAQLGQPSLSADGSRIAVPVADNDPIRPRSHVVVMGVDGSNARRLTSGDIVVDEPRWAPSGTRLSYAARPSGAPRDSARVMLADAAVPGAGRVVCPGVTGIWLGDSALVVQRASGAFVLHDLATGAERDLSRDSTTVIPIPSRGFDLVIDLRRAQAGMYVRVPSGGAAPPRLALDFRRANVISHTVGSVIDFGPDGTPRRRRLPDLAPLPIARNAFDWGGRHRRGVPPNAMLGWDDHTLLFTEPHASSKLVLIEHLRR